jgi:hypothetical protein
MAAAEQTAKDVISEALRNRGGRSVVLRDDDDSLDRRWLVVFPKGVTDGHGGTMAYRATKREAKQLARQMNEEAIKKAGA